MTPPAPFHPGPEFDLREDPEHTGLYDVFLRDDGRRVGHVQKRAYLNMKTLRVAETNTWTARIYYRPNPALSVTKSVSGLGATPEQALESATTLLPASIRPLLLHLGKA